MPMYHALGELPPKRHIQFRAPDGELYVEEVFGLEGFEGAESILYHRTSPCRIVEAKPFRHTPIEEWQPEEWVHRHLRLQSVPGEGDAISGRRPFLFNNDVIMWHCRPVEEQQAFYRNGQGDEIVFVQEGSGVLRTIFGSLPYREGDYLVIPRGVLHRFEFEVGEKACGGPTQRHLVLETPGHFSIPKEFRNKYGQLMEHAPYYHRDIRMPEAIDAHIDEGGEHTVLVRVNDGLQEYVLDYHPFDVVGWDGYCYPWALNIWDYEPRAGRIHQPPPAHLTFRGPGFVVCSFMPRMLDWDPRAVVVPYHHSNLDSEEVLFYVNGNFKSRKGIDVASVTLHPSGLPHGPQPGVAEATLGQTWTDEAAVMVDTFRPLRLAAWGRAWEDPSYRYSWRDSGGDTGPLTVE